MATIEEKLDLVSNTKEDIAEAIVANGGTLADDAPFSTYADAINNIPALTEDYVTEEELTTTLGDYVLTTALDTKLEDYDTSDEVDTKLESYYTSAEVDTKLEGYTTNVELTTTLGDYVTEDELNTTLGDYDTSTEVDAKIAAIDIPSDTADLTNGAGYITNAVGNLANYYLKTETYTQDEVDNLLAALSSISFEKVDTLPTTGEANKIYLLLNATTGFYDEYIYANDAWDKIGDTQIDLSDYVTTTALTTALAEYLPLLGATLTDQIFTMDVTNAEGIKTTLVINGASSVTTVTGTSSEVTTVTHNSTGSTTSVTDGTATANVTTGVASGTATVAMGAGTASAVLSEGLLSLENAELSVGDERITDVATPTEDTDAANKEYVDTAVAAAEGLLDNYTTTEDLETELAKYVPLAGTEAMTGAIGDGTNSIEFNTDSGITIGNGSGSLVLDPAVGVTLTNTGVGTIEIGTDQIDISTATGNNVAMTISAGMVKVADKTADTDASLDVDGGRITGIADPTADSDAINKSYFDTQVGFVSAALDAINGEVI